MRGDKYGTFKSIFKSAGEHIAKATDPKRSVHPAMLADALCRDCGKVMFVAVAESNACFRAPKYIVLHDAKLMIGNFYGEISAAKHIKKVSSYKELV